VAVLEEVALAAVQAVVLAAAALVAVSAVADSQVVAQEVAGKILEMAQEIERKFLVKNNAFKAVSFHSAKIIQGFLSSIPERTVRIRIKDATGYITVKGIGNESGTTRFEWEKEIPLAEAVELLKICEPGVIDKTRFNVKSGNHTFEVDEFNGENEGLLIAEIELNSEDETFEKPTWLGEEVTGQTKYYNASLMKNPFKNW
jgi:adenylate cyclase